MEEGSRDRGYYISLAPPIMRWAPPLSNTYHSSFVTSLQWSITQDETRRLVKLQTAGYTCPKQTVDISDWTQSWQSLRNLHGRRKKGQNKKERVRQKTKNQRKIYKPKSKKLKGGSRKLDDEKVKYFRVIKLSRMSCNGACRLKGKHEKWVLNSG